MVTPVELGVLAVAVLALYVAYRVLRAVKPFVVNAVVGLVVLLLAGALGYGVSISWLVVLVVAVAGVPGALLVLVLAHTGLAFQPALLAP